MPTKILITDDSGFARKQMTRALPPEWDVEVLNAADGKEAIGVLLKDAPKVMFLDLNMPVMDGYETLEAIIKQDIEVIVIVVSGDIQPLAVERVTEMGALEFVKKPINKEELSETLRTHAIFDLNAKVVATKSTKALTTRDVAESKPDNQEGYQEIANVAMGRAADLLAKLLDSFVVMPIPLVNMIEVSELRMAIQQVDDNEMVSGVCQGFIGAGIAGEALLIFNEASFEDIADLMKYVGDIDEAVQVELLMDIANILIGACLKGIAEQLDINFSQGHPLVIGRHVKVDELLGQNASHWTKTLTIEMGYKIEDKNISCDLLLLFTEDSIKPLDELVSYLID
ncbi:Chemotaxis protein CheC -- inhibitor of MCP methylation [hydrothermal vent metagenome]|uniref:Chemotaxis protein CheC -- inhibitor of MCP methylation n=1 Tax=hydrothermal vent metagenome TaxID=652676 RepID=A0A3B1A7S4_9ZZZZ